MVSLELLEFYFTKLSEVKDKQLSEFLGFFCLFVFSQIADRNNTFKKCTTVCKVTSHYSYQITVVKSIFTSKMWLGGNKVAENGNNKYLKNCSGSHYHILQIIAVNCHINL